MRHARDATLEAPKLLYPSIQVNIRAGRFRRRTRTEGATSSCPLSVPES